jgi:hypothetical protein
MDFNLHSSELNNTYSKDELLKSLKEYSEFKFSDTPNEVAVVFDSGFFAFKSSYSKLMQIAFPIERNKISRYNIKLNTLGKRTIGISTFLFLINIFIIATGGHLVIILSSVIFYIAILTIFYNSIKSDSKTVSKKIGLKI